MNKPIATSLRTKEILERFHLYARKSLGQNFITDPSVVRRIAESSRCQGQAVIEIGPGIGALTEQLALLAKKVVAFEIDDRLPEVLAWSLQEYSNVEIRHQDFLKADLPEVVADLKQEAEQVVLCANLPYYITTPLLFKIFESEAEISVITVMMQKEVGDRMAARVSTKDYNALSVLVQYGYEVKTIMKVPRTVFNPKPNVDSSVVQFVKRKQKPAVLDEQLFFEIVKACFKQRRKTIYNNLREYLPNQQEVQRILQEAGIDPTERAENLELETFIRLSEVWYERKSVC